MNIQKTDRAVKIVDLQGRVINVLHSVTGETFSSFREIPGTTKLIVVKRWQAPDPVDAKEELVIWDYKQNTVKVLATDVRIVNLNCSPDSQICFVGFFSVSEKSYYETSQFGIIQGDEFRGIFTTPNTSIIYGSNDQHRAPSLGVPISPNDKTLLMRLRNNELAQVDVATGSIKAIPTSRMRRGGGDQPFSIHSMAYSKNSNFILVTLRQYTEQPVNGFFQFREKVAVVNALTGEELFEVSPTMGVEIENGIDTWILEDRNPGTHKNLSMLKFSDILGAAIAQGIVHYKDRVLVSGPK
jgi:hypothetical protein